MESPIISASDESPRLWLVRLGRNGDFEPLALSRQLLSVDFGVKSNLAGLRTRSEIAAAVALALPQEANRRQANVTGQLHRFVNEIAGGDVVVAPLRTRPIYAIGEITGAYQQLPDGRAARPVRWLSLSASRSQFGQDLLYSLGALMTVCEVRRPSGAVRVATIAETGLDPGR